MRPARTTHRRTLAALSAGLVVALSVLAGCSSNSPSGATDRSNGLGGGGAAPAAAPQDAKYANDGSAAQAPGTGGNTGTGTDVNVAPLDQSIVYTGSLTVRVDDVNAKADQADAIAEGGGGHVGADKRSLDAGQSHAELTLRVPSAKFSSTLDDLAKLGTEISRSTQADDVSEAVVDINARIVAEQASVDRVQALLAKATTIGEVVSVESELTRRESDLAALQARQRNLADQVSLSTITLQLLGPDASAPAKPDTGFMAGLRSGWHAFLDSMKALLTFLGAVLPFVVAFGIPLWIVLWFLRGRRRPVPTPEAALARAATAPRGSVLGGPVDRPEGTDD
jgi:hypothetical protein